MKNIKRRIISALLATIIAVPCYTFAFQIEGSAASTVQAKGFVLNKSGVLTKYTGSGGNVVVPSGVKSIGSNAFFACTKLTSVTIPAGVTSIGSDAFCRYTAGHG